MTAHLPLAARFTISELVFRDAALVMAPQPQQNNGCGSIFCRENDLEKRSQTRRQIGIFGPQASVTFADSGVVEERLWQP